MRPSTLLTYQQASHRTGLAVRTLQRFIAEGRLPKINLAGTKLVRLRVQDVDRLIAESTVSGGRPAA